ncbi:hypothetical protein ACXVUM_05375 [Williamsia sp. SKLECPSW1]
MSSGVKQPRSGAVMLEESLQRDIRRALGAAGVEQCAGFVLVEFGDTGLRASVVDAATGTSLVEHGNGRLCPHMIDLTLADHLVRIGRVTRPESTQWAAELIGLMPEIRGRLAVADGAFAMGTDNVAMFRMSRVDCITALESELTDAATVITTTVREATLPVDAVVVMPDHELWPGLVAELSDRLPLAVVALDAATCADVDVDDRGRHTAGADGSEDPTADEAVEPAPDEADEPTEADQVDEPAADEADEPATDEPDAPGDPAAAADAPTDDTTTEAADVETTPAVAPPDPATDVTQPISVVRPRQPTADAVEQGGAGFFTGSPLVPADGRRSAIPTPGAPVIDRPTAVREAEARVVATGDQDVVRTDPTLSEFPMTGPRSYAPPGGVSGRATGPGARRRLALGAVAVGGAVVLGGVILAVPWMITGSASAPAAVGFTTAPASPSTPAASAASGQPTPAQPPAASQSIRPPIDTRAARVPVVPYIAPPPVTSDYVAPARPGRPAPRPAPPRRRTIPNPIPGLPPIVLP